MICLINELKDYIYEAFNIDKDSKRINLYNQGSEIELPEEMIGKMDFAFSCPPYFNLEQYCEEETQCYIKYPNIKDWLEGYVKGTIQNIYKALKKGAYYAVNIADFKVGNEQVKFVDEWINLSKENGFEFIKEIPVKMGKSRPNSNSISGVYVPKDECIYLFKKN